jgi:hypothetical protein
MPAWNKTSVMIDGRPEEAIAPVVISASRATDIPAFFSAWLANRLKAGWCGWTNPFNGRFSRVSFEAARVFVFWSKNPEPLIPLLGEWDQRGLGYYFQFTLNDYDHEGLEPRVPALEARLDTFKRLSDRIGPDRVIWRFDPLLITTATPPERLLDKVVRLGQRLSPYTRKLVFSFADIERYQKVARRLKLAGVGAREFTFDEREAFARGLARASAGWGIEMAACAEEHDLSAHGIGANACIDGELLKRLYPDDRELMAFLGRRGLKDRGQRKACRCIQAKDIGAYNTCPHGCVYCYANAAYR